MCFKRTILFFALVCGATCQAMELPAITEAASHFRSGNPKLDVILEKALLNPLLQASEASDGTIYVKTGDIPAQWLRDSSAEVTPLLLFAKKDAQVASFLKRVIKREMKALSIDPYANAYREDYSVWEERLEIDSVAYPVILAWTFWKVTGDGSLFDADFETALHQILTLVRNEQNHRESPRKYRHPESLPTPASFTGMIWDAFRPSDDPTKFHYLIPAEMMLAVALDHLGEIETKVYRDLVRASFARELETEIQIGIETYGKVATDKFGLIYAYEVDGLGNHLLMDDANLPSLLSAPYFGYLSAEDPVYLNTRKFILSEENPYFFKGKFARGVGSPHTETGFVWPLSIVAQGLTSHSASEQKKLINMILASDPGDHLLHESFDPNQPKHFTREDFGWPNSLFAEWVLTTVGKLPALPKLKRIVH